MNRLKEIFKTYLSTWWIPILCNIFPILTFILGILLRRYWIIDFALFVFYVNALGTVISTLFHFWAGNGLVIIPQLGAVVLLYAGAGIFLMAPHDFYAAHKEIPIDIVISYPLDSLPKCEELDRHNFFLLNDFQPGIYIYQTDYKPTELGYFYVKAFEISSGDQLSENRVDEASKISVDSIGSNLWTGGFTIYEGDWGDEYGSRMELWFKPIKGQPFIVEERNYIIEGWLR